MDIERGDCRGDKIQGQDCAGRSRIGDVLVHRLAVYHCLRPTGMVAGDFGVGSLAILPGCGSKIGGVDIFIHRIRLMHRVMRYSGSTIPATGMASQARI